MTANNTSETLREKVSMTSTSPGVYLMKDSAGRVIYVGKAKNLRSRAGSYFLKAAAEDQRTSPWIGEIADIGEGWRLQVLSIVEDGTDLVLAENRFRVPSAFIRPGMWVAAASTWALGLPRYVARAFLPAPKLPCGSVASSDLWSP